MLEQYITLQDVEDSGSSAVDFPAPETGFSVDVDLNRKTIFASSGKAIQKSIGEANYTFTGTFLLDPDTHQDAIDFLKRFDCGLTKMKLVVKNQGTDKLYPFSPQIDTTVDVLGYGVRVEAVGESGFIIDGAYKKYKVTLKIVLESGYQFRTLFSNDWRGCLQVGAYSLYAYPTNGFQNPKNDRKAYANATRVLGASSSRLNGFLRQEVQLSTVETTLNCARILSVVRASEYFTFGGAGVNPFGIFSENTVTVCPTSSIRLIYQSTDRWAINFKVAVS
jgi:hypothetical protein